MISKFWKFKKKFSAIVQDNLEFQENQESLEGSLNLFWDSEKKIV